MKLVTVGLFAVGVIAAVSAAVLVASMQGGGGDETTPTETAVVVATRDLAAMAVIDEGALVSRTVKAGLAPAGSFSDPVQLIGKVLTAPVKAGQAITSDAFAADGSASRLAATLPAGRRAVSVTLSDMNAASLLYPGCFVDVLATMRVTRQSGGEHPVTITLLQGVSVLAVGRQTIVSPSETAGAAEASHVGEQPYVALLVDSHQAEKLKLAMEEGTLSLVLRNPSDSDVAAISGADMAALVQDRDDGTPINQSLGDPSANTWEATVLRGTERENRTFVLNPSSKP